MIRSQRHFAGPDAVACTCLALFVAAFGCSQPTGVSDPEAATRALAAPSTHQFFNFDAGLSQATGATFLGNNMLATGNLMTGTLIYDETQPDQDGSPKVGTYISNRPPSGIEVFYGNLRFASDPDSLDMVVQVKVKSQRKRDSFSARSNKNLDVLPGIGVASIELLFVDNSGSTFANDALAGINVAGLSWSSAQVIITGVTGWQIVADISSIAPRDPPVIRSRDGFEIRGE